MSAGTQAKILRLLQDGRFERLGGSESVTADVRIIAATNQDLDALIEQGKFRKDLYYRLRGVTIHLPPLRERQKDIAEFAHFLPFSLQPAIGNRGANHCPRIADDIWKSMTGPATSANYRALFERH